MEEVKEKKKGNTGLPFGLCKKHGLKLHENATPREAWIALGKIGITPKEFYAQSKKKKSANKPWDNINTFAPKEHREKLYYIVAGMPKDILRRYKDRKGNIDYDAAYEDYKGAFVDDYSKKSGNSLFDNIKRERKKHVKINGTFPEFVKPYELNEIWIYPRRGGGGYYFSVEVNGKREYITVDSKTANGRHYIEDYTNGWYRSDLSYKISANGYIYIGKNGNLRFTPENKDNFKLIKIYRKYD